MGLISLLLTFLIKNVNAEVVKVNLSEFKFNNINLLDLSYYNIPEGNRSMYFDYDFSSVDENATILYNSVVICSDAKYTSAYASDPSEVSNIRMNNTSYNCSYHNSSYTGGRVVIITFVTYSSGANSIVLYQNGNASVQLIDFVVDSSGYVNPMNFSSQSLIYQNSQIINQNNTIINTDIPDNDKHLPSKGSFEDFKSAEKNLTDKVKETDTSVLSIGIDSTSSSWVWDTLTSFIKSNTIIFGMFIAILSIGVIKLGLGR